MKRLQQTALGVALALLIAIPSWFLGRIVPIVGAPIFAIIIGMALSFFRRPQSLEIALPLQARRSCNTR